jgi:hypothetical protein
MISALMLLGVMLLPYAGGVQAQEHFKPFVLASRGAGDFDTRVEETRSALNGAGFDIVGEYTPYADTFVDNTRVIIVTNDELKTVAGKTKYGSFAAPWRVAVTKVADEVQVSYVNPNYIARAYRLESDLSGVSEGLERALGARETFGSEKGLTERKLRKYRYTFGMEYFDDVYTLAKYDSHKEAVAAIENNLAQARGGVSKVYRLDLDNDVTVFGVARKATPDGDEHMDEAWIMQNVDFKDIKGTAYLPYEILVDGGDVVALHMRFRMALHYPDLKMMGKNSFMQIMPSPKANETAFKAAAGGK